MLRALKSLRFGELDASQIKWNGVSWGKPADVARGVFSVTLLMDDLRLQCSEEGLKVPTILGLVFGLVAIARSPQVSQWHMMFE
jgi:hypothetical protein